MASVTLTVLQKTIITLCEEQERNERSKPDFSPCIIHEPYFIKYAYHSLYPQYKTQQYIYEMAVNHASAPRIPKVYDYFSSEHNMRCLVMEYIVAKHTSASNTPEKVAGALEWLRSVPPPPDVSIGPVGGGRARHTLFNNYTAPNPFSSKEALQRYMNRALEWIPLKHRPEPISFSEERPIFTQSDMDESNFFLDTNDMICMIDFEDVGLLPQCFASFTMHCGSDPFTKEVAKYLDWSPSHNLNSMARAGAILNTMGDTTLGLDKDGWPKARR